MVVENCLWLFGNVAIQPEAVATLLNMGIMNGLKGVMGAFAADEKVTLAALWVLQQLTLDQSSIKPLIKALLEIEVINAFKRFANTNQEIFEWSEMTLRRVKAYVNVNSHTSITARLANKPLFESAVMMQVGDTKPAQKHMVLLNNKILLMMAADDNEISLEVKLRDVLDISPYPPILKDIAIDVPSIVATAPM